jgi:hypothetical protein
MHCSLQNELNFNLMGMVTNEWNVSCRCNSPGYVFRFDVERCMDHDECAAAEEDQEERCSVGKQLKELFLLNFSKPYALLNFAWGDA